MKNSDDHGNHNSADHYRHWKEGMTRRRFLSATASATGTFFLAKTSVLAKGLTLLAHKGEKGAKAMNWEALKSKVKGTVVTSASPNFGEVTKAMVWNELKPDRAPDVIVTVKDDDDVVECVNFARENGLKVVVHGGGHTWCGLAVRNGGMTVDLSQLTESKIDKVSQTAVIQPVISNRDVAHRLGEHDLAFPIGHCPTVKASGYLLNGGMSWNMGHWGPGCYSINAIEFVTADGKKVKASKSEHPDLFWAARGCGPGMFAVATRYHLKCYPLPKGMMSSTYFYSLDDLQEVADEIADIGWNKVPDKVELSFFMKQAPEELQDKFKKYNGFAFMIACVAFTETREEGLAALAPFENAKVISKCVYKSINEDTNFSKLEDASGATWPEGLRNYCENQGSNAKPSEVLMALRDKFVQAPSPLSVIVFCQATGGHNLVQTDDEVALSMNARFYGGIWTMWKDAKDDAVNKKSHEELAAILRPFTSQHYIGETDYVADNRRVKDSYTPEKWKKMEEVRAKYDPNGVFFGFLGGLPKAQPTSVSLLNCTEDRNCVQFSLVANSMGKKTSTKSLVLTSVCVAVVLQGCHQQSAHDSGAAKEPYPSNLSGDWKVATTEDAGDQQNQSPTSPSARHRAVSQMFAVEMIDDHHNLTGTGEDQNGGFVFTGVFKSPEISMVKVNNKTGERITFDGKLTPGADPPYATGRWQSTAAIKQTAIKATTTKASASGKWEANFYPPSK